MLNLGFDPSDPNKYVFATNFKTYTAMTFCIHNDFKNSSFGRGQALEATTFKNTTNFIRYKAPQEFLNYINEDYTPLGAMSVDLQFGYTRLFNFTVIGAIYTKQPVSEDVAATIVAKAKEALSLFYAPVNREYGDFPNIREIVDVIEESHELVSYFDSGNINYHVIEWLNCDPEYFNLISYARYIPTTPASDTIIVAPSCIIKY